MDRALYDGKSEAGMSSRQPEADGLFHIRFNLNGEEVVLKTKHRKLVNTIDVNSMMGLKFDEDGLIVDVLLLEDMPLEMVAWQFFIQSVGGNTIKANSSEAYEGMEVLLQHDGSAYILDMVGKGTFIMNGGRLTANSADGTVDTAGTLNITACGDGKIVAAEDAAAGLLYNYKGFINVYGGQVDASKCKSADSGAVYVGFAGDVFTVYGGTITGSKKATNGGSVYTVTGTELNLCGGTIQGGQAATNGGNINVNRGSLTISGGTVTGGKAVQNCGGVYMGYNAGTVTLSGNAKIYDNEKQDFNCSTKASNFLTVAAWSGNGEGVAALKIASLKTGNAVAVAKPAADTTLTAADLAKFQSADTACALALSGGNIVRNAK